MNTLNLMQQARWRDLPGCIPMVPTTYGLMAGVVDSGPIGPVSQKA